MTSPLGIDDLRNLVRDIPDFPPSDEIVELTVELLPEKFNKQSTLRATIKPGRNTMNFDLTKN